MNLFEYGSLQQLSAECWNRSRECYYFPRQTHDFIHIHLTPWAE